MFTIINRATAHARGSKRFFTGRACKHGHVDERWVSTGSCLSCARHYREGFKDGDFSAASTDGLRPATFAVHPDDVPIVQSVVSVLAANRRAAIIRAHADIFAAQRMRAIAGGQAAAETVVRIPDVEL